MKVKQEDVYIHLHLQEAGIKEPFKGMRETLIQIMQITVILDNCKDCEKVPKKGEESRTL